MKAWLRRAYIFARIVPGMVATTWAISAVLALISELPSKDFIAAVDAMMPNPAALRRAVNLSRKEGA